MRVSQELIESQDNPHYERSTFTDLIKGLLKLIPGDRTPLEKALEHDFFHEVFDEEYEHFFERVSNHFQNEVQQHTVLN